MLRLFCLPCYTANCMKKAAGRKSTVTNDAISKEIELVTRMTDARQLFIASTLNLSWRLALSVLIPLIGGIQLDKKYDTEPLMTLLGLLVAFVLGSLAVWATVKEVNELQSTSNKQNSKEK